MIIWLVKRPWATSRSRITLRVFGGYDFENTQLGDSNWEEMGCQNGVPVGADLQANTNNKAPQMIIWALKGPNSANLDGIQVIKGWVDAIVKTHEKIHDIVWSGDR
jgi:hypothetical protein